MNMSDIYELFCQCFPDVSKSKEIFDELTSNNEDVILYRSTQDDSLIAFSIVSGNVLEALCVREEFRNRGIGSKLLKESESKVVANGFSSVCLGFKGKNSLLPGVPYDRFGVNDSNVAFFKKRGYYTDEIFFDVVVEPGSLRYHVDDFITTDFAHQEYKTFFDMYSNDIFTSYLEEYPNDNYLVCRSNNHEQKKQGLGDVEGVASYRISDDSLIVDDFQCYNVYENALVRKSLFSKIASICEDKEIRKVILSTIENPDFYRKECDAKVIEQYWPGQKSGIK